MILAAPIRPHRGTRGMDAYGSGVFAASRDGGKRLHRGRDYITVPGDTVYAPTGGVVTKHSKAYPDSDLAGIEIESSMVRVKILYMQPSVAVGERVTMGQAIGVAQDVAAYWHAKEPKPSQMASHIHLEIMVWVDAEDHMGHGDGSAA